MAKQQSEAATLIANHRAAIEKQRAQNNLAGIRFLVSNTSPLLMHNPASMVAPAGDGNATVQRKQIPSPEKEAAASAYRLPSGQLYMQAEAFRSSFIDGVRGQKIGKASAPAIFSAALFVIDGDGKDRCGLVDERGTPITEWLIDTRRAIIQDNGIMRSRAKILSWWCVLELEYDPILLNPQNILQAANSAGRVVGVGDYRPKPKKSGSKGGPYGRFVAVLA